jgi:phytoene synthase
MRQRDSEVFKRESKTFSFASFFFPSRILSQVEQVYAFLRWTDDLAELTSQEGKHALWDLDAHLDLVLEGHGFDGVVELIKTKQLERPVLNEFVRCMKADQPPIVIESEEGLLRYCYGAAGTVGLMLTRIFEVQDRRAYAFAIDLGVAMQLTNVVRDIFEDYTNRKIYLPELKNKSLSSMSDEDLLRLKAKYIALAEKYYQSSSQGLVYLPLRIRLAVGLASRLYRQIGLRSLERRFLRSRAFTSRLEKFWIALGFIFRFGLMGCWRRHKRPHRSELHQCLQGLPYVDSRL